LQIRLPVSESPQRAVAASEEKDQREQNRECEGERQMRRDPGDETPPAVAPLPLWREPGWPNPRAGTITGFVAIEKPIGGPLPGCRQRRESYDAGR
jgi:hypothetical protein